MRIDLSAKAAQKVSGGEGGVYYSWSSAVSPILSEVNLAGGKLLLHPLGLALPHYADSSKVGYVLQGTGRVGMILSTSSEEKVCRLTKGDIIPVPRGMISWWFNDGDTDFSLVFLGETSKAHTAGEFTYFLLGGSLGILNGLSTEFLTRAFHLDEEDVKKIVKSQTGVLLVKLEQSQIMPEPSKAGVENIILNADAALPDIKVEKSGQRVVVTCEELTSLAEVEFSTINIKLQQNAVYELEYSTDSAFQMIYIVKGSGRVQIVGTGGKGVLDETVKADQFFVVPRFFVISVIAGGEGMEWYSVVTSKQPTFTQFAGKTSVWKALSPEVVQASLNISPELEERFREAMSNNYIFSPPSN